MTTRHMSVAGTDLRRPSDGIGWEFEHGGYLIELLETTAPARRRAWEATIRPLKELYKSQRLVRCETLTQVVRYAKNHIDQQETK